MSNTNAYICAVAAPHPHKPTPHPHRAPPLMQTHLPRKKSGTFHSSIFFRSTTGSSAVHWDQEVQIFWCMTWPLLRQLEYFHQKFKL